MSQDYSQMARYMRRFFSGTLVSRMSGMVRDIGMAAAFGDHPSVAAFMVAFRFSHLLRRIFGEGMLQAIFTPHYQSFREKGEKEASLFFLRFMLLVGLLLLFVVLLVEGILGVYSYVVPQSEVRTLFSWLFPCLFFIGLYGLNLSVLQCHGVFFASSAAPAACNAAWIFAVFLFARMDPSIAMKYLTLFIIGGFVLQWVITLPKVWNLIKEGKSAARDSLLTIPPEVTKIGKASLWGLLGIIAVQCNSFLDMLFAGYSDARGPVYLWYAIRLAQLPLALVGFACVYSITPALTRYIVAGQEEEARKLFSFGYRRIFLFVIPCTFAVFSLGFSSVQLLFGRGSFSWQASVETTWCLWAYALSLLPSTLVIYQSSLFYAYGDAKTPMKASIYSVLLNVLLNSLLVFVLQWGAISIALSTSVCSFFNYYLLRKFFNQGSRLAIEYVSLRRFINILTVAILALFASLWVDQMVLGGFFFKPALQKMDSRFILRFFIFFPSLSFLFLLSF